MKLSAPGVFADDISGFDECIDLLTKFQCAMGSLMKEFKLYEFQMISILLEETIKNMKGSLTGSRPVDSLSKKGENKSPEILPNEHNCNLSSVIDSNIELDIDTGAKTESIPKRDVKICSLSRRNYRRRGETSNTQLLSRIRAKCSNATYLGGLGSNNLPHTFDLHRKKFISEAVSSISLWEVDMNQLFCQLSQELCILVSKALKVPVVR